MQREHPARPSLAACSPTSRTLRAGCAGGLRPSLTPAARAAWTTSRRDGKTAFQPNQKTTLEESISRTTYALRPADIFTPLPTRQRCQDRQRGIHELTAARGEQLPYVTMNLHRKTKAAALEAGEVRPPARADKHRPKSSGGVTVADHMAEA